MLGLNETMHQLAMANCVCWYGHGLRGEDGHVLSRALDFEVDGKMRKLRLKRTWKMQVDEESMMVGLRREYALFCSRWSVSISKMAAGLR